LLLVSRRLPKEDEHEFNSSGDDWLNEVLVVDDEVDVELTWVAGAGTALRGPYRRNGRSTTFRHRKKRRDEATASAAADKKAGLKQTSLNSASETASSDHSAPSCTEPGIDEEAQHTDEC